MINFADIGSWHFVTELDVIEVTSASDVSFTIADSGGTILNGTYTPVTGTVRIYHLARLLRPLIDGVTAVFTFTAGSTSKTVHVVQSGVTVSESAATFLPSFFLSAVMTERDTSLERKELLTLLPIEQSLPTVQAVCSYWDGDAVVTANKPVTTTSMTANTPFEIDVSAALFVDTTIGTLVAYSIVAGERTMRFRVTSLPTAEYAMLFRNTFGAWEPIYFAGMTEEDAEYTRETSMVNGALKLYNLEETASFKSWTGPLRPSGVALARDLARCITTVCLLERGMAADVVVISNVEVKHTSADNEIADFTFTWRRSAMWSVMLKTVRPPKLFDETFDETYN